MQRVGFRGSHMPFVTQKYQCFHLSDVGLLIKTTRSVSRKVRPNIAKKKKKNAPCLVMQRRLVDMCMHR